MGSFAMNLKRTQVGAVETALDNLQIWNDGHHDDRDDYLLIMAAGNIKEALKLSVHGTPESEAE